MPIDVFKYTEFDIHIKDNFIESDMFKFIYEKIPFHNYSGDSHRYRGDLNKEHHLFFAAKTEPEVRNYVKERCEKLYNKKFEQGFCDYTMVMHRKEPMPHHDLGDDVSHQIIIYIRGEEGLNKGTGFYTHDKKNNKYVLNTHVGFNENRGIFWDSHAYHSPLLWNDEDKKSMRYSIVSQFKEIKDE